jgi:N-acetylglutamate synthase-like GNAT family acetyltransferase
MLRQLAGIIALSAVYVKKFCCRHTEFMDIRPYRSTDREACLQIFDSNVPSAFQSADRVVFEHFLEQPGEYFVMEHDGAAVGCGGYRAEGPSATLQWGMVRRDCQKMGLGRFLLMFRLREIGKAGGIEHVRVTAPVQAASFFERQGFRIVDSTPGRVALTKRLSVCA